MVVGKTIQDANNEIEMSKPSKYWNLSRILTDDWKYAEYIFQMVYKFGKRKSSLETKRSEQT